MFDRSSMTGRFSTRNGRAPFFVHLVQCCARVTGLSTAHPQARPVQGVQWSERFDVLGIVQACERSSTQSAPLEEYRAILRKAAGALRDVNKASASALDVLAEIEDILDGAADVS